MHVITVRNVRSALPEGVAWLLQRGERSESRIGPVLVSPEPVTTVYLRPTERVLLSPVRDANPAFHIGEALWMLVGRNDTAFLDRFIKDFGARFGDGGIMHGAYGHRWRQALGFDQLDAVVEKLKKNPDDRQAVIQMWDARSGIEELYKDDEGGSSCDDLMGDWKDRPCNTQVMLRVRQVDEPLRPAGLLNPQLDMMVTCRSNDIIMGAYGANAVHFSVLQEYLAARIGVAVGTMTQVSWNFHAYERDLDKLGTRAGGPQNLFGRLHDRSEYEESYQQLVDRQEFFDAEVRYMLSMYEEVCDSGDVSEDTADGDLENFHNKFLSRTAWPLMRAFAAHRGGFAAEADAWVNCVYAADWATAMREWLGRRRR